MKEFLNAIGYCTFNVIISLIFWTYLESIFNVNNSSIITAIDYIVATIGACWFGVKHL